MNHFPQKCLVSNLDIHISPLFRSRWPILLSSPSLSWTSALVAKIWAKFFPRPLINHVIYWLAKHLNVFIRLWNFQKVVYLILLFAYGGNALFNEGIFWNGSNVFLALDVIVIRSIIIFLDIHDIHLFLNCFLMGFVSILKVSLLLFDIDNLPQLFIRMNFPVSRQLIINVTFLRILLKSYTSRFANFFKFFLMNSLLL